MRGGRIAILSSEHSAQVNDLRLAEYATAAGFKVQPPGLLWNRSDDQSTILGAWVGDELVGTLRLELIEDLALVERMMECPWSFPVQLRFPVLVLSKMATKRDHRQKGLSILLRWHAFTIACHWGARQAVGTFTHGSPRQRSMQEMGYEFHENKRGWHAGDYKSEAPVLVAVLDLETQAEQALEVCRQISADVFHAFSFEGALPAPRPVRVGK